METLLVFLKVNIGMSIDGTESYNARLIAIIEQAKQEITQKGITLDATSAKDNGLVVDYATWLWLRRRDNTGMPIGLRKRLNDRLFAEKMHVER